MINSKHKNPSMYAIALSAIARRVKSTSYSVLALHEQHAMPFTAERLLQLYRYWLDLAINRHTAVASLLSRQLLREQTREEMTQYALRGRRVKSFRRLTFESIYYPTTANAQTLLSACVQEWRHLLLEACCDFNKTVLSTLKCMPVQHRCPTQVAQKDFDISLMLRLRQNFQQLWFTVMSDLEQLGIQQPPLFFVEHFAKLLGWSIGALADLLGKPTRQVISNCQRSVFAAGDTEVTWQLVI